jgi:hypothetical protein
MDVLSFSTARYYFGQIRKVIHLPRIFDFYQHFLDFFSLYIRLAGRFVFYGLSKHCFDSLYIDRLDGDLYYSPTYHHHASSWTKYDCSRSAWSTIFLPGITQ